MPTSQQPFVSLFPIAAFIMTGAGISLLFRYRTLLARYGGILMLAVGFEFASYFLVLTSSRSAALQMSFRILVTTYSFLVVSWLFFIFVFCGHARWINRYTIVTICLIPIIMGWLVLTVPEIDPIWISQGRDRLVIEQEFVIS